MQCSGDFLTMPNYCFIFLFKLPQSIFATLGCRIIITSTLPQFNDMYYFYNHYAYFFQSCSMLILSAFLSTQKNTGHPHFWVVIWLMSDCYNYLCMGTSREKSYGFNEVRDIYQKGCGLFYNQTISSGAKVSCDRVKYISCVVICLYFSLSIITGFLLTYLKILTFW